LPNWLIGAWAFGCGPGTLVVMRLVKSMTTSGSPYTTASTPIFWASSAESVFGWALLGA